MKLGRLFGADGLLLLNVVATPQGTNLALRLLAVKPGVVLTYWTFPWPLTDAAQWAQDLAPRLEPFLPKLALMAREAIPISVMNLRYAIAARTASETERALTLLTIQRLSREPRFFVLERRKMWLLADEKEVSADESAFWSGSYLLEGVVDRNGISASTLTLDVRLVPPTGGAPAPFQITSSRTNLAEAVNLLAAKVASLLELKANAPEWAPAEEAANYFDESKWALRWGAWAEAESAADSAWMLGKTDPECALARLDAYRAELSASVIRHQFGEWGFSPGYDNRGNLVSPSPPASEVQAAVKTLESQHPFGFAFKLTGHAGGPANISYAFTDASPDPAGIDRAVHLLELYRDLTRFRAQSLAKPLAPLSETEGRWARAGLDTLTAASRVLQDFHLVPSSQPTVAARLAELRAAARSVAEQMSSAPFARDSYFVGNRFDVPHDLHAVIPGSIWECMAAWGAFWEETPEDCLALYRRMMTSPAFCYIHKALWLRSLDSPRLTAWNDSDRARVDLVWKQFTQELGASTNVLCRLEAKALAAADAETPADTAKAINELFAAMLQNREAFLTNNVNLLYLNWQAPSLAYAKLGPMTPEIRKSSQALAALHDEWERAGADRAFQAVFEKQKDYLKQNTPCEFFAFANLFDPRRYTKAQALELRPLVEAYRSNLFARAATAAGVEHGQWKNAASLVGFVEGDLDRILAPTQPGPASQPPPQPSGPAVAATKPPPPVGASVAPPALTNIFTVDRFLPVPLDRLAHDLSAATITACHWQEGRLVLDLACSAFSFSSEATAPELRPAIAVLDPEAGQWSVVAGPGVSERTSMMTGNRFYHRTALCGGQLFTSQYKQVKQYDPATRSWRILDVPGGENCELFAVNGRLFAANRSMIMEILDHGQGTRVLASNRRRPPASALDAADLGTPTLFEGSGHSLRACTANKISTWIDGDWREASPAPPATLPPVIGPDGLLFVADGWNLPWCVSRLTAGSNAFEFCMGTLHRPNPPPLRGVPGPGLRHPPLPDASPDPKPAWSLPPGLSAGDLSFASRRPFLYVLADHSTAQKIVHPTLGFVTGKRAVPKDGYHAALLRFSPNGASPDRLGLLFDAADAPVPVSGEHPLPGVPRPETSRAWMLFANNQLFLAQEQSGGGFNGANFEHKPFKIGVWSIPTTELDRALPARDQPARRETQAQLR